MWKWNIVSVSNLLEFTGYEMLHMALNTGVSTVKLVFLLSLLMFFLKREDFIVFSLHVSQFGMLVQRRRKFFMFAK